MCVLIAEKDRVISPNHSFGADYIRQLFKYRDHDFVLIGDVPLDIFAVGCNGKLKIVLIAFELIQLVQHIRRVLCPEHDAVDHIRREWDAADSVNIHRISDADKALLDAVKEPLGVVVGNVGTAACTDDHVFFLSKTTIL